MWVEQHGNKWRIRDVVDGKKVNVESGFPTKTVANQRKKRLEIEKIDLGPVKAGADKVNFGQWADAWWKGHARTMPSAESRRTEGNRFRRHVVGRLGHLAFKDIDHAAIRAWLDDLAEPEDADYDPIAAKTILNVHGYLYMCLATAVKERVIRTNPCADSDLPSWEPKAPRFLSESELAEVIGLLPGKWRPIAAFIAGTGCRAGEAFGLRQRRVDLLAGKVRFETQMRIEGGKYVDVPLKTKASRRTVGIGPSLVQILVGMVSPDEEAFVFRYDDGRPVPYTTFRQAWRTALKKTKYEGVRIHDLRHTHASLLIAKGRPLTSIQRRLGHSSIKVTSDVYGGLLPEVEEDTTAAVESFMAGIGGGILGEPVCNAVQSDATTGNEEITKPQVRG